MEYEGEYLYDKKWNGKGYDQKGNIIYELNKGNGKVREYSKFGVLIFDGEYLNGKKNGKGKQFNRFNGNLVFEGEYLNGKQWTGKGNDKNNTFIELNNGKGIYKEFFSDGQIKNECEMTDGEITGNVKMYDGNGKLLFNGQYFKGKKNGKGKEYDIFGNLKFEGIYVDGNKYTGIIREYERSGKLIKERYCLRGYFVDDNYFLIEMVKQKIKWLFN